MWLFFRYQRGSRSLVDNLSTKRTASGGIQQTGSLQDEEEEYDIPDEIEDVIGQSFVFINIIAISCLNSLFQEYKSSHKDIYFQQQELYLIKVP